jgi:hypothetical protein
MGEMTVAEQRYEAVRAVVEVAALLPGDETP